jgi:acyl-CoA synthetase (NDP forming)
MDFERLINPRVCALIGASNNPRSESYRFVEGWLGNKFTGKIYLINPKYTEIQGIKVYPDIREIPDEDGIDYVLIAVPADKVLAEVQKCVEKKVRFIIIFTSGFSEIGNKQLEDELVKITKGKSRILGPNCIGVYSTEVALGYFSDQPIIAEGNVSFVSQSGGLTRNFIWNGISRGFHIRATVSVGNTIDVSVSELFEYFAKDPKTHIIGAYLESVKEGHDFFSLLKTITPHKPVVIMKCGRTPKGKIAAQSHTGAMAGSYDVFTAMAKQAGGLIVETVEELADTILGLQYLKSCLPQGKNVAIINTGGGIAVEMTDICESNGFTVADLKETTRESLKKLLPPVNVIIQNPIDLGAYGFNPEIIGKTIDLLSQDPHIHVIFLHQEIERFPYLNKRFQVPDIGKVYTNIIQKSRSHTKPIISILPRSWELREHFIAHQQYQNELLKIRIPSYPTISRAIFTLQKLLQYRTFLNTHKS